MSRVVLPVVETGPEALFRLGEITASGRSGVFRGSMAVGPWLEVARRTPAGAVAVLVDDVLAYAITEDEPPGMWSVSAEITLDVLRPLPTSGASTSEARLVHADSLGGLATGTVTDATGPSLALTQPARALRRGARRPGRGGRVGRSAGARRPRAAAGRPRRRTDADHRRARQRGRQPARRHLDARLRPGRLGARARTSSPRRCTSPTPAASRSAAEVTWRADVRHPGRSLAVVDVDGVVDGPVCTTARVVLHPPVTDD